MKKIAIILFGLITLSCFSQENLTERYLQKQDSLRNELLNTKKDSLLIGTVFEEHYLRGLVKNEKECLKFKLPFNLHGPDCGAPDCYTTELTFEIPNEHPLELPKKITITGTEFGCVESNNWTSKFELIESNTKLANYFSAELKSNLFFTKNGNLIYFPHEKSKSINLTELNKMYEGWEFDDAEIAPYKSTIMERMDYESFVDKK